MEGASWSPPVPASPPAGAAVARARQQDATRAARMMLSSSLASSAGSSLLSQTPSLPSYGSYLQHRPAPPPQQSGLQHYSYQAGPERAPVRVVVTDDLVSGTRQAGRLSPVRRFFVLLSTFDLLFTCLLWLIAILVTGRDLTKELREQVLHYEIAHSMFDCVVAAAFRFSVCLSFYGFLEVSHWAPIFLSTSTTMAFLVAKVFLYLWQSGQPITYDVMLILLSFILSWGEVWFYDFRLIPLESRAAEVWGGGGGGEEERAPLLPAQSGLVERFLAGSTLYEGSLGNFYSPMESPELSDEENEEEGGAGGGVRVPRRFRRKADHPLSVQEREFVKQGEEVLATAWRTLNSPDWRLERADADTGDTVMYTTLAGKKLFKLTGRLTIGPARLLEELFYRLEEAPSWNPTLVECRTVQPIDQYTDISYQVCAEAAGGAVSQRDFVNLRHWAVVEGVLVSAGCSVEHPAMPPRPRLVRGHNGPSCFAVRSNPGQPGSTTFHWLLDTDLKGWIPQSIIDKALTGAMFDYIKHLRSRVAGMNDKV